MIRSSVDLPPPLGPSSAVNAPRAHGEVDVVERDEVAEALADAPYFDPHQLSFRRRIQAETRMAANATSMSTSVIA